MKFKFIQQHDAMQCGVACMAMICHHFGKDYTVSTLNPYCTPSSEGVSLKGMADLCESIGLDYAAGRIDIESLIESPLPCVLHWGQNHFVVLYSVIGKKTEKKTPENSI